MFSSSRQYAEIGVQDRDIALLRGLFETRLMNPGHIADLYFDGRREATKKRLQKLKARGLISSRSQTRSVPSIVHLSAGGINLLRTRGFLEGYSPASVERRQTSRFATEHELSVVNIKAAMYSAEKAAQNISILEFITRPSLCQFATRRSFGKTAVVRPDGLTRISNDTADGSPSTATFFLEVDRSTEKLDTLISKAKAYVEYYRSGGFALANGSPQSEYRKHPFRALFVLKSIERRNNLIERLLKEQPSILSQVWLATFAEVNMDPFGPIWLRPFDCRNALNGMSVESSRKRSTAGYARQTARDFFIERSIPKVCLFG